MMENITVKPGDKAIFNCKVNSILITEENFIENTQKYSKLRKNTTILTLPPNNITQEYSNFVSKFRFER